MRVLRRLAVGLAVARPGRRRRSAHRPPRRSKAGEVNLYSSRHYDSDRALYEAFTSETGIRVRLIEGDADQLIERIRNEGANSPADVFITVDAARLARAAGAGVLQPFRSPLGRVARARRACATRTACGSPCPSAPAWSCTTRRRARRRASRATRTSPTRSSATRSASAAPRTPTMSASPPPSSPPTGRRRRRSGRAASSPTWPARRRAATATSSAPSPPASAASPSPTPTTSPASAPPSARRTRRCSSASAWCSRTRRRATAART